LFGRALFPLSTLLANRLFAQRGEHVAPEQRRLETRRRRILVDEPANEHVLRGGVRHAGRRFQSVIDAKQNRGTLFDTERGGRAERGRVRDIRHGRRIIDADELIVPVTDVLTLTPLFAVPLLVDLIEKKK
jgi:hypothetical protein